MTGVRAIAAGGDDSLALLDDGTVRGWGRGAASIPTGLHDVVAIYTGYTESMAITADNRVVMWSYLPGLSQPQDPDGIRSGALGDGYELSRPPTPRLRGEGANDHYQISSRVPCPGCGCSACRPAGTTPWRW